MPVVETAPGVRIHYDIFGEGLPVVFLHGWGMSGERCRFHDSFASRYRFITPDLRGHGLSSAPPDSEYSLKDFADDLVGLFTALSLENVILAGWSMGAQVALQAFPLLRTRLAALVLVSGTPRFVEGAGYPHGLPAAEPRGLGLLLRRDFEAALIGFFNKMAAGEKDMITKGPGKWKLPQKDAARKALNTLVTSDIRHLLPGIDLPVLLMHGRDDAICPLSASEYMAGHLPKARLAVMEGGHAPFLSNPALFTTILTDFLDEIHAHD